MRRISVAPADRLRRFVVVPDVATNLAGEVRDGREDAPGQKLAFDLREPKLDLIQPGRIRRGEMEMDGRMIQQKRPHGLGLVGRQVVRDHVNLPALRLRRDDGPEEFDERGAGMSGHGLTKDFAGLRVEGGQQGAVHWRGGERCGARSLACTRQQDSRPARGTTSSRRNRWRNARACGRED